MKANNDNNKIALSSKKPKIRRIRSDDELTISEHDECKLQTYRKIRKNIPKNKNIKVGNDNNKTEKKKVGRPSKVVVEEKKSDYDASSETESLDKNSVSDKSDRIAASDSEVED